MDKRFIWLNEAKKRMIKFTIGYIIDPGLNSNKSLSKQIKILCLLHLVKSYNFLINPH